jgi:hypothetical protein
VNGLYISIVGVSGTAVTLVVELLDYSPPAATAASSAPSLSAIGSSLLTPDPGRGTDVAAAGLVRGTAVAAAAMAAAATDGDPDRPGDEGAATAGGVVADAEPTAVAGGVVMGSSSGQYVYNLSFPGGRKRRCVERVDAVIVRAERLD